VTDQELRDAAEAAFRRTTVSYPDWKRRVDRGLYHDVTKTQWWQGFDALDQIGGVPPPPPPPLNEPKAIAGQGYRASFFDDFTQGLDIGDANRWYPGEFYYRSPAGTIELRNNNLLMSQRRAEGWPMVIVSTLKADKSKARTFRAPCYAESRFRWTAGPGAWPGFWLFSHAHAMGTRPPLCSEFDIFEGQGSTPYEFSGALHEDTPTPNHAYHGCWTKPPGGPNMSTWHTYAGLWLADKVQWYVDDNLLCTQPTYASTNQPMYLLYSLWNPGGWGPGNVIGPTTPDVLELEVDWVRVWQK
jgi:glycosyl hydrolase family 16